MRKGRRRFAATAASLALGARAAVAQTSPKRVVLLARSPLPEIGDFRAQMRELGWEEGRTWILEERYAGGETAKLQAAAGAAVRSGADVLVCGHGEAAQAAKAATTVIPIVFSATDPVAEGLVASLARPGGNATGFSYGDPNLSAKRVETLHDAFPTMKRVGVLYVPGSRGSLSQLSGARAAAAAFRIEVVPIGVASEAALAPALTSALNDGIDALVSTTSPLFRSLGATVATLAATRRVPVIYETSSVVDAGGLMSFGPDWRRIARRMADYVDRILKGATPSSLPVEQQAQVELVINLRTATALGLTIPPSLVALADRVIE